MLVPCLSNFPEIHVATRLGSPVHMNMLTKKKKKNRIKSLTHPPHQSSCTGPALHEARNQRGTRKRMRLNRTNDVGS